MDWRVIARGLSPSGEAVVHLCTRTGLPASEVRRGLVSDGGLVIREGIDRDGADSLAASLSFHGITLEVVPSPSGTSDRGFRVVLTGYSPGSRGRLRTALMRMSRRSDEEVIGFLARIPFALRRNANPETAASVRRFIEAAGGVVEIRPEESGPGEAPAAPVPRLETPETPVEPGVGKKRAAAFRDDPPEPACRNLPPSVETIEAARVFREPHRYTPLPPDSECAVPDRAAPPEGEAFPGPHRVVFSAPARPTGIPPIRKPRPVPGIPPAVCGPLHPVFMCPVPDSMAVRTVLLLQSGLGLSARAAERAVRRAPSVVALGRDRLEASEKVRELSSLGLPVTLVRAQNPSAKPGDHVWFGNWLRAR
jgi:hypothetical protein